MRCSWLRCFMRVAVQAIGWKGSDSRGAESGALPSGCHEAAVPAGTARDEEEGDGIEFSKNLRLVRGKVASRKELSHRPCMSSIPAASTYFLKRYRLVAHGPSEMGRLSGDVVRPAPRLGPRLGH